MLRSKIPENILERLRANLELCYPGEKVMPGVLAVLKKYLKKANPGKENAKWSEKDVILITYADSMLEDKKSPLQTLHSFLLNYLQNEISIVHLLPFFPYSSDDGFSVIDYREVNPTAGNWADIARLSEDFSLMFDFVVNHASAQGSWFKKYLKSEEPYLRYFKEASPEEDLSEVVRPRSSPLLQKVSTARGEKYVWCTFSHDQIDLNFENPEVLIEFLDILLFYASRGARVIRLDAVAFLWKKAGTKSIHLPETHAIIRIFRDVFELYDPRAIVLTETNVPNRENLSYFGNRNEAHMIYNFSLPPLLVDALTRGRAEHLKSWMMSMPPAPFGCTYMNFTASHDGIGLRPAEGLLSDEQLQQMLDTMRKFGARISMRSKPDKSESPYEVNISLFEALKGTVKGEDDFQVQRFIASQVIMMSLEGIPAFYIHALFATPNDYEGLEATGHNRSINRKKWKYSELETRLNDINSVHGRVFSELKRLVGIRKMQPAFHPNATQYTLQLGPNILGIWRQSLQREQSIFAIVNLSDESRVLHLTDLNLIGNEKWVDLIEGTTLSDIYSEVMLKPYQCLWLSNQGEQA